jgi:hypothetical protein
MAGIDEWVAIKSGIDGAEAEDLSFGTAGGGAVCVPPLKAAASSAGGGGSEWKNDRWLRLSFGVGFLEFVVFLLLFLLLRYVDLLRNGSLIFVGCGEGLRGLLARLVYETPTVLIKRKQVVLVTRQVRFCARRAAYRCGFAELSCELNFSQAFLFGRLASFSDMRLSLLPSFVHGAH